jgi:hypothetical protein
VVTPPSQVEVRIESKPSGATVEIDGVRRGTTPLVVEVPRSSARSVIELRARDHASLQRTIVLDQPSELKLELEPCRTRACKKLSRGVAR